MKEKIYIAIAEDHDLVRDGLIAMLSKSLEIEVAIEARNGKELLNKLKEFKPNVVLLDIEMPKVDGIIALGKIKRLYPDLKVIVISVHSEITSVIEYLKRGAISFLTKNCNVSTVIEAINKANKNESFFEAHIFKMLAKNPISIPGFNKVEKKARKFSERDIKFLKYISEYKSYADIGKLMGITEGTASWYRHKLQLKTNTVDIDSLIAFAKQNILI